MEGAPFEYVRCRVYVGKKSLEFETESSLTAIVILALVALFIGLRLYSVLGERTGHEQPILKPADPEADARMQPQATARGTAGVAPVEPDELAYLPMAGPGVRALLAADASFDVGRFLDGSKSAYRMILEAFWKGDLDGMRPFVDDHVFETFAAAVEQRSKDGRPLPGRHPPRVVAAPHPHLSAAAGRATKPPRRASVTRDDEDRRGTTPR
jgi:hypothetical protein